MTSRWAPEDSRDVEQAMGERLSGMLDPGERLSVFGESFPSEVHARFTVEGGPRGEKLELESRVDLDKAGVAEPEGRDLALDALDLTLFEWLESERRMPLSGAFEERELSGKPVRVRAERTFPGLEARADALLKGEG
jgi:hypothetical protein